MAISRMQEPRQLYGLGSIVKKAVRGVKKVAKSPIGKAALLYAGTAGLGALAGGAAGTGFTKAALTPSGIMSNFGKKKFLSDIGTKLISKGEGSVMKNLAKLGIGAATALPLLGIGTQKQQEQLPDAQGGKFDYDYNKMRDRFARAETEEDFAAAEEEFPVTPGLFKSRFYDMKADGGRIGFALGSKADFAIEDVMTGGMEDEIGGITGIMRQADLQRKGNVGQFYAAQGGRMGYADGGYNPGARWSYLIDKFNNNKPMTEDEIKEMEMLEITYADETQGMAQGGRIGAQEGGIMDLGGMEKDYRNTGGFVDLGAKEKADDVPARLSVNEFVMTADAVRGAGDGDINLGAERMENLMEELEQQGRRNKGAADMFEVSERLSEVV